MVVVALLCGPVLLGVLLMLDYYEEHMLGEAQPRQSSRRHLHGLPTPPAAPPVTPQSRRQWHRLSHPSDTACRAARRTARGATEADSEDARKRAA
ncbi:hypothetical protein NKH77_46885 [Streptomyces sp. M19]